MKINASFSPIFINILLIFFFTVAGSMLRIENLGTQSYWMDEGYTVNAVQNIEQKGNQVLDSGFSYSCPLYCYPSAWIAEMFGDTAFSYRLLAAIAGILFIIAAFFVGKQLFSSKVGLLASFFTAFSYFQIAWSRQARWYTLFELFFWISIFFFWKAIQGNNGRKKQFIYAFLTALFTSFAILTHGLGYVLPLIFLGWTIIDQIFISKKLPWKKLIPFGVVFLLFIPFIIEKFGIKLSYSLPYYLSFYLKSYWILILLSVMAVLHPKNVHKQASYFLVLVLAAYLIPLSFLTDVVNYRYLFHITPVFFILGASGVLLIASDMGKKTARIAFISFVILLFFVNKEGIVFPQERYVLESDTPRANSEKSRPSYIYVPQPDWNAAYTFVKENMKEGDVVVSAQPVFNKIFLSQAGYWIKYSYSGKGYTPETADGREWYVGAKILDGAADVKALASTTHGYVIMDRLALQRLDDETVQYLVTLEKVFEKKDDVWSEVVVWRF